MSCIEIAECNVADIERWLGNPREKPPIFDDLDSAPGTIFPVLHTRTVWETNRKDIRFIRRATGTRYGTDEEFYVEGCRWSSSFRAVKRYLKSLKNTGGLR